MMPFPVWLPGSMFLLGDLFPGEVSVQGVSLSGEGLCLESESYWNAFLFLPTFLNSTSGIDIRGMFVEDLPHVNARPYRNRNLFILQGG